MHIIYNDDDAFDLATLCSFINDFTKSAGLGGVLFDIDKCSSIIQGMKNDFPCVNGIDNASVFKKLANFIVYFVAERPIKSPFSAEKIGIDLSRISNHQNAIIALEVAMACLHQSSINHENGKKKTISNSIKLSKHSYIDIIDALAEASPSTHFKMVAVLLEQLTYKENPECQYKS